MIKILIGGDYCPHGRISKLIETECFDRIFKEIIPLANSVDYSIINLECPVVEGNSEPISKYGINLKTTPNAIKSLKYAGFKMVTLANNHFFDFGQEGIKKTLELCKELGVDTVGGGENLEQAEKILYKEIKGKKFAFINCCEHEFSIATEVKGGSNPLNPIAIYHMINEAKNNSDYLIIIVHGGHEHFQLPSPRMKELYRFFVDVGADVVVNHHQHCYSGFEEYKGKKIFYGLGNFCFDWVGRINSNWNEGILLELIFQESDISFQLHPFTQGDIEAGVVLMNEEKKLIFNRKILSLNRILTDNNLLKLACMDYYINDGKKLLSIFEPYSNHYLYGLYRRNLLPSFITKNKMLAIRNIIECEAHHEKIIYYLKSLK